MTRKFEILFKKKSKLVIIWICVNYTRNRSQSCIIFYNFITSHVLLWSPAGSVGVSTDSLAGRPKVRDLIPGEVKDFPEYWNILEYDAISMGKKHFRRDFCIHFQALITLLFLGHSDLEEWRRYFLRNIENYLPLDTVICFRLLDNSPLQFWDPLITPRLSFCHHTQTSSGAHIAFTHEETGVVRWV